MLYSSRSLIAASIVCIYRVQQHAWLVDAVDVRLQANPLVQVRIYRLVKTSSCFLSTVRTLVKEWLGVLNKGAFRVLAKRGFR
jgi:hypothetical protein